MTNRTSAAAAVILGVAVLASPGRGDEKAAENARARLEAARKTYEGLLARYGQDATVRYGPEDFYRWSRRWMEAERDLADKPEARVAAAQGHLDRMAKWEGIIRLEYTRGGTRGRDELAAAEFFRLEAEDWLAQAKAK